MLSDQGGDEPNAEGAAHGLTMTVASFLLKYLTERIGQTKLSGFQQAPHPRVQISPRSQPGDLTQT